MSQAKAQGVQTGRADAMQGPPLMRVPQRIAARPSTSIVQRLAKDAILAPWWLLHAPETCMQRTGAFKPWPQWSNGPLRALRRCSLLDSEKADA